MLYVVIVRLLELLHEEDLVNGSGVEDLLRQLDEGIWDETDQGAGNDHDPKVCAQQHLKGDSLDLGL